MEYDPELIEAIADAIDRVAWSHNADCSWKEDAAEAALEALENYLAGVR